MLSEMNIFNNYPCQRLYPPSSPSLTSPCFDNYSYSYHNSTKDNLHHHNNIFCFHSCSVWSLIMKSIYNKVIHQQPITYGKIINPPSPLNISINQLPSNISNFLPLDLLSHQRFVLDETQPKEHLNLQFNFVRSSNTFTNINMNYSNLIFEFNLLANLHGIEILKNPINFKVKGYDIVKSIQNKLRDINYLKNYNEQQSQKEINTTVFRNIQCTFIVTFVVSKFNIAKYISQQSQQAMNFNINLCEIQITKLNIIYCLPLSVFNYNNIALNRNFSVYFMNHFNQIQQLHQYQQELLYYKNMHLPLFCRNQIAISKPNKSIYTNNRQARQKLNTLELDKDFDVPSCNWYSFMTCTTPFILEKEHVHVYGDILSSFNKSSLFGVRCTFQVESNKLTQVNYYPSLSSVSLIIQEKEVNNNNVTNNVNLKIYSDSMSLNGSFQTNVSDNLSNGNVKTIVYKEKNNELYNMGHFTQQLRDFVKSEPEIKNLTLDDVSKESWFSIIWSPIQTFQPKPKEGDYDFIGEQVFPIFKVFYQFRQDAILNKGKFITVIGIMEKSVKGKNIQIHKDTDRFWFGPLQSPKRKGTTTKDCYEYNKELFYSLEDQAKLIEL